MPSDASARRDEAWVACVDSLDRLCRPPDSPHFLPDAILRSARLLWTCLEAVAARQVLEIGIGPDISTSAVTCLHWLQTTGGALISIDIDRTLPRAAERELAQQLGVSWHIIHGDSLQVTIPGNGFDVVYVDGAHDQTHATGDVRRTWPLVRPGGYLIFDDYPGCAPDAEALPEKQTIHVPYHDPDGQGRMVIQRAKA